MDHDCQRKAFGGIMEETQNPVKRRSHSCPYCTYTTDVSTNLHKHITTHTGEKAYACPYCPYRSNSKDHVKRHTLTHTGEKPFACTKCHYRSTQKSHIKSHMFTHHWSVSDLWSIIFYVVRAINSYIPCVILWLNGYFLLSLLLL